MFSICFGSWSLEYVWAGLGQCTGLLASLKQENVGNVGKYTSSCALQVSLVVGALSVLPIYSRVLANGDISVVVFAWKGS